MVISFSFTLCMTGDEAVKHVLFMQTCQKPCRTCKIFVLYVMVYSNNKGNIYRYNFVAAPYFVYLFETISFRRTLEYKVTILYIHCQLYIDSSSICYSSSTLSDWQYMVDSFNCKLGVVCAALYHNYAPNYWLLCYCCFGRFTNLRPLLLSIS